MPLHNTYVQDYFPAIKSYSKSDICALLVDPKCNPASYTGVRFSTRKLKRMIMGTAIDGVPMYKLLGFATERDYTNAKVFTPSQSELILRELL